MIINEGNVKMTEMTWNNQLKEWLVKSLSKPELDKGARVKIKKNSRYAQKEGIETSVRDSHGTIDRENYMQVTFDDGDKSLFHKTDLELVNHVPEEQMTYSPI
ncbi:MAG: hypothetical protein U9R34_06520 [Nanoarchaeota archaeon]|nr:hypothetical protein [Nanoarchaeota archaeon]